jgi:hypothetical protein
MMDDERGKPSPPRRSPMPTEPKTAEEWAEWAMMFVPKNVPQDFDPLNDHNHLALVWDELERRVSGWEFYMNNPALKNYEFGITEGDGSYLNADGETRTLAVLRAAWRLEND